MVRIVHPKIDYNKCVGLLECYGVCPADVFNAEKSMEGKRAFVARPEDSPTGQCVEICSTNVIKLVED